MDPCHSREVKCEKRWIAVTCGGVKDGLANDCRVTLRPQALVDGLHNLTDNPGVRYTEAGIARAVFRVAVSGRREQEPSFFTWSCGAIRPSTPASRSPRAAGSWS
jgi:hypothetical protein